MKVVFTKARYSAGVHQGLVLSLLLFIIVLEALSRLGSPGKTSMPMTLLSLLNRSRMCQEAFDLERSNGGERTESKINAGKMKIMICGKAWTSCRVQASFHVPSVALEWAATASSAMAASTGCTRNAVGSSA